MTDDLLNKNQFQDIEDWLISQPDESFPRYFPNGGEKSYPERYKDIRLALIPIHNNVEKGALLNSTSKWRNEIKMRITQLEEESSDEASEELEQLRVLIQRDPSIYLNQHGIGHVNKVIEKANEIIDKFSFDPPTPSEVFLLLCAIQLHDVGNIFGREGHEKSFQNVFIDIARPIIPDAPTRNLVFRIARVHSGNIDGNKDTISASKLRPKGMLFNKEVREQMLAALLRFADELADDSSRADLKALDLGIIPEESLIYHEYSKSLHVVEIGKNEVNKTMHLSLEYYIDSLVISTEYNKEGNQVLLIDEIFSRTIKMEQERRYCMRFLSQYLPLVEIKVRIEIVPDFDLTDSEVISYTLKENGYPLNDITIDCPENTGKKVIDALKNKGWRL